MRGGVPGAVDEDYRGFGGGRHAGGLSELLGSATMRDLYDHLVAERLSML